MEPKGSLPHSQVSAACHYPEPARFSPCPHIPLSEDPSYYITLPSTPGSSKWFFPPRFPTKTLYMPLLSPYVLHAPPISFFSSLSHEQYWMRCTDH